MLAYNVLNDYVERLKKQDLPVVAQTDNVTTLTTEDINKLRAGDIVTKITGNQKHTYIVSYKENNQGICLTYTDASVVETVSYDYNSTTKEWIYNSTDIMPIQHSLTAGDNITINNNIISATDTTYTAGTNITITDGVISASGGQKYTHHVWCDFTATVNNVSYTFDFLCMVETNSNEAFTSATFRDYLKNLPKGSNNQYPLYPFLGYVKTSTHIYAIGRSRKASDTLLAIEYIDDTNPSDVVGLAFTFTSIAVYSDAVY